MATISKKDGAQIEITRAQDGDEGRYDTRVDGHPGLLLYTDERVAGGIRRNAYSTRVDSALSGRGVGLALVERLVADARREKAKIVPQCSFVRKMIERNKDWGDVLAEEKAR